RVFFDLHSAAMAERAPSLRAFDEIDVAVGACGRHGASIVTSAYSSAVAKILGHDSKIKLDWIHAIAGREHRETKTAKILRILSGLGLAPSEAIYVGDLESDILYCRDVPIDIVAV